MLVLSRKVGESIHINDNIKITVTRIEKGDVRISIDAPREVPVYREELYHAIKAGETPNTRA